MADRRGRRAEFLQIVEAPDPGAVTANPGVVEDRRDGAELGREIGCVDAAMRGVDDNRALGLRSDAGDAVGDDDRGGNGRHPPYAAAAGPRAANTSRMPAMMRVRFGKTWSSRTGLYG